MPLRLSASLMVPLSPMSVWLRPKPTAAPTINSSASRASMPPVTPAVENLADSTGRPVLVILPNSSAPLAQTAIGGPDNGSQFDNGEAGRGGIAPLPADGNTLPVPGSM